MYDASVIQPSLVHVSLREIVLGIMFNQRRHERFPLCCDIPKELKQFFVFVFCNICISFCTSQILSGNQKEMEKYYPLDGNLSLNHI